MRGFTAVLKRELTSYFTHPTAYAVIIIFLLLSTVFAFTYGSFLESRQAELSISFFFYHPLLHMLLVPAVGMRLWSEEQRTNTIELLGTMPISSFSAICGKFAASCCVWIVALALSFPMVLTVSYLGDPDFQVITGAFIGSFLVAACFLSVTMLISAFSKDQVVTLIASIATCMLLVLIGYEPAAAVLYKGLDENVADSIMQFSVFTYFDEITRGLFRLRSLLYFVLMIGVCLWGTAIVIRSKRA